MDKLRALIVDDEFHARENLRMLIDDFCPEIKVVADASGVNDALDKLQEFEPDVVFLDIRMPSGSEGFDFLEKAPNLNFQVVFVTAFKDYAVQAFNANAIHYVLKPVDIEDLRSAVEKLIEYQHTFVTEPSSQPAYLESLKALTETLKANQRPKKITLHHQKGFRIVNDDEIVRLEADGTYTTLYFKDGASFYDSRNMKIYDDMLDPAIFCRVHKSHIINIQELREYLKTDGHIAVLSDGSQVPVARARLSDFLTRVKSL
ncbi:LytR/AlgR family response regulator transcription factor [Sanyastnella coralliicola]|uniref:LytR/AlgR family response regulator transcription factor n=1 Tax=Sanyastnella coralliicola TaxID=3069118 RepID=UPI0027BA11C2|nr:LytTR family DNA-binding domain-containing protein [Longitalea sp. SCSIO 12813]